MLTPPHRVALLDERGDLIRIMFCLSVSFCTCFPKVRQGHIGPYGSLQGHSTPFTLCVRRLPLFWGRVLFCKKLFTWGAREGGMVDNFV